MRFDQTFRLRRKQSGSTLVISLIILVLLMLLGVTAMRTSDTQFQLAGNLQFEDSAMNNAEAALGAAETWLATGTNFKDPGFTTYSTGTTPQLYPISATPAPLTMTWDNTNSFSLPDPNNFGLPNPNQLYMIQLMSVNNRLIGSSQTIGGRSSSGCNQVNTYLVTARGSSARGATKFVQSFYSVLSC